MTTDAPSVKDQAWPEQHLADWKDTRDTLHMWTQIAGKPRLSLSPHQNHWWEVPLYVTARGLATSPIPFGAGVFDITFDFIDHRVDLLTSWGPAKSIRLYPRTVADFYGEFMESLHSLGIEAKIWPMPVEVLNPIRFDEDTTHKSYDPQSANRFWRILVAVDIVLKEFRARFIGKDSPVHFFWGSFDMAVTRFSGRRAPANPSADPITRDAYSHEVISAGFWPGGTDFRNIEVADAAFYAYAVPQPAGFNEAAIRPKDAFYHQKLGEYLLMYDNVRRADSPKDVLLDFLQTTYDAAATLAKWDRNELEKHP